MSNDLYTSTIERTQDSLTDHVKFKHKNNGQIERDFRTSSDQNQEFQKTLAQMQTALASAHARLDEVEQAEERRKQQDLKRDEAEERRNQQDLKRAENAAEWEEAHVINQLQTAGNILIDHVNTCTTGILMKVLEEYHRGIWSQIQTEYAKTRTGRSFVARRSISAAYLIYMIELAGRRTETPVASENWKGPSFDLLLNIRESVKTVVDELCEGHYCAISATLYYHYYVNCPVRNVPFHAKPLEQAVDIFYERVASLPFLSTSAREDYHYKAWLADVLLP